VRVKPEKIVQMACPACKIVYGEQPFILLKKDGTAQLIQELPKACPRCRGGMQRHVVELPRGTKVAPTKTVPEQNHQRARGLQDAASIRQRNAHHHISSC